MSDLGLEKIFQEHDSRQWGIEGASVLSAAEKKRMLLAMPMGSQRPHSTKHPLGVVLWNYTSPTNNSYDPEFDKAVRKKFTHWFVNSANEKKKEILAMPKGSERPKKRKHPLGIALGRYTSPTNGSYCPEFDKAVRNKFPHWFVNSAEEKKKKLLAMPKNSPKPHWKHDPLSMSLKCYTSPKNDCYDPKFNCAIRRRQPGWFKS